MYAFFPSSDRANDAGAAELVAGLEIAGFAPFLDRHDIASGEPWPDRTS